MLERLVTASESQRHGSQAPLGSVVAGQPVQGPAAHPGRLQPGEGHAHIPPNPLAGIVRRLKQRRHQRRIQHTVQARGHLLAFEGLPLQQDPAHIGQIGGHGLDAVPLGIILHGDAELMEEPAEVHAPLHAGGLVQAGDVAPLLAGGQGAEPGDALRDDAEVFGTPGQLRVRIDHGGAGQGHHGDVPLVSLEELRGLEVVLLSLPGEAGHHVDVGPNAGRAGSTEQLLRLLHGEAFAHALEHLGRP